MLDLIPTPTPEEKQSREAERQKSARLRMLIWQALNARNIVTPKKIGTFLDMPSRAAIALLDRKGWREGDLPLLEAAAARLGVHVPP